MVVIDKVKRRKTLDKNATMSLLWNIRPHFASSYQAVLWGENKPNQSVRYMQNGWFTVIVILELLDKEAEESCWLPGTSGKTTDTENFKITVAVDVQISICRLTGRPVKRNEEKRTISFKISGKSCVSTNSKRVEVTESRWLRPLNRSRTSAQRSSWAIHSL